MELTQGYRGFPGKCTSCGAADSQAYTVDFNAFDLGFVRMLSRITLCGSCVLAAADLVAPVSGKKVVAAEWADQVEHAYRAADVEAARADAAEARLAELAALASQAGCVS